MLVRPNSLDSGTSCAHTDDVNDPSASADRLGEALHFLRMSGIIYCRSEFTAPWALALPAMKDWLMFHVVTSGRCWLEVEGAGHRPLQPGDLALVPVAEVTGWRASPAFPRRSFLISRASRSANVTRSSGMAEAARLQLSSAVPFASTTRPLINSLSFCRE
jgi:hypothetical protein